MRAFDVGKKGRHLPCSYCSFTLYDDILHDKTITHNGSNVHDLDTYRPLLLLNNLLYMYRSITAYKTFYTSNHNHLHFATYLKLFI